MSIDGWYLYRDVSKYQISMSTDGLSNAAYLSARIECRDLSESTFSNTAHDLESYSSVPFLATLM